jgi:hypothetical protein
MPQVMEMKIDEPGFLDRRFKRFEAIRNPSPVTVMKDPRHINPGAQPHEDGPEGPIDRQTARPTVLRLLQVDESVGQITTST